MVPWVVAWGSRHFAEYNDHRKASQLQTKCIAVRYRATSLRDIEIKIVTVIEKHAALCRRLSRSRSCARHPVVGSVAMERKTTLQREIAIYFKVLSIDSSLPMGLMGAVRNPLRSPLPVFLRACLIVSMLRSPVPRCGEDS